MIRLASTRTVSIPVYRILVEGEPIVLSRIIMLYASVHEERKEIQTSLAFWVFVTTMKIVQIMKLATD